MPPIPGDPVQISQQTPDQFIGELVDTGTETTFAPPVFVRQACDRAIPAQQFDELVDTGALGRKADLGHGRAVHSIVSTGGPRHFPAAPTY